MCDPPRKRVVTHRLRMVGLGEGSVLNIGKGCNVLGASFIGYLSFINFRIRALSNAQDIGVFLVEAGS